PVDPPLHGDNGAPLVAPGPRRRHGLDLPGGRHRQRHLVHVERLEGPARSGQGHEAVHGFDGLSGGPVRLGGRRRVRAMIDAIVFFLVWVFPPVVVAFLVWKAFRARSDGQCWPPSPIPPSPSSTSALSPCPSTGPSLPSASWSVRGWRRRRCTGAVSTRRRTSRL